MVMGMRVGEVGRVGIVRLIDYVVSHPDHVLCFRWQK